MSSLIFTNHALERIKERKISQDLVLQTFSSPDSKVQGKKPGTLEFTRRINNISVTLITKQNEKNDWILLSAWIDPPYPGTKDYADKKRYQEYQKAGFWRKIWLSALSQLGF